MHTRLPEWLDGKVDTAQIAANSECAAFVDGGGTLWLSQTGSKGWSRLATNIAYPSGLSVLKHRDSTGGELEAG
jgi:hypothetical protein